MKQSLLAALGLIAVGCATPGQAAEIPADLQIDPAGLSVSRDEMVCLALNDYWESRGEPLEGRVAVAQVVLNRAMDERYPTDLCAIVRQGQNSPVCQFSWACDGLSDEPSDKTAWRESVLLAAALLSTESAVEDITGGAKWFHATHVRPAWRSMFKVSRTISNHIFYRDRKDEANPPEMLAGEFVAWQEERAAALQQVAEN